MSGERAKAAQQTRPPKGVRMRRGTVSQVSPLTVSIEGSAAVAALAVPGVNYTVGMVVLVFAQEPGVGPAFPASSTPAPLGLPSYPTQSAMPTSGVAVGQLAIAADTGWTWRWALGRWSPWTSTFATYSAQYLNWSFAGGSVGINRWRWEEGFCRVQNYIKTASGTSNSDQLVISTPYPIRFEYGTINSPTVESTLHIYDPSSGLDFQGKGRPNREYAWGGLGGTNPSSIIPKVMRVDGGYAYVTGIGSNTPFVSGGIPANSEIWLDSRYETSTYPFA